MTEQDTAIEQEDEQAEASGADAEEGKAQQREESDPPAGNEGEGGESDDEKSESQKAQEKEEEREQAAEKVKELEDDPPPDLEDWPDDAAQYETLGGAEGDHGYHEGPEEEALGPSSLRHHEDGSVSIAGEKVDNPEDYKSDPIPGGPTDPNAGEDLTTKSIRERQGREMAADADSDDDSDDSDGDSSDGASASSDSDSDAGDESESSEQEKAEQSS